MAVLSDKDLEKILIDNDGIIILNKREKSITGLGYDLTIGFIRDSDTGEEPDIIDKDEQARYTLLPGHRYLVISKEFLYLSSQYMATLHSRGSYALKGIIVSSTTVDPNYAGCITCSLFNCTSNNIYIKKENQFVTMVFHDLRTSTIKDLQLNERGMPMDTRETFHGKHSNIHSRASKEGDIYCGHIWDSVKYEYNKALKEMYSKVEKNETSNAETPTTGTTENSKENSQKKELMQITFLIGNGFDLNLGLRTSYKDFYMFYIEQCPEDLLAKAIEDDLENWSDLESSLGKHTKKISPEIMEQFRRSELNLENKLEEYLKGQMELADLKDDYLISREMNSTLKEFYNFSRVEDAQKIKKILVKSETQKQYAFVSFNYTDVLDQCLDIVADRFNELQFFPYENKKVLHIHGLIQNRNIVLGVNDEGQIANESLRKSDENFSLVKKDINDLIYKNTNNEEMDAIIDKSDVICIFGMSFGETDKRWWQSIVKWLKENPMRNLVLFSREMNLSNGTKEDRFHREQILKHFFDNGDILESTREEVKKRIYVVGTTGIFDFKLRKEF